MSNTIELPKGLRGHSDGVDRLRDMFVREGGEMSQSRFDELVRQEVDNIYAGRSEYPMRYGWSGDDYLFVSMHGEGMWGYFLQILQAMVHHKLASQRGKLPNVIYSCPAKQG